MNLRTLYQSGRRTINEIANKPDIGMVPDLYEELSRDPYTGLDRIANTLLMRISRGSIFRLDKNTKVEIPDRQSLRNHLESIYGIKSIDSYFVPMLVDTTTYNRLLGIKSDTNKKSKKQRGHVEKIGNWYVAFCEAIGNEEKNKEIIDHEVIHTFISRTNPYYKYRHSLFSIDNPTDLSWGEAIAYVAANGNQLKRIHRDRTYIKGITTLEKYRILSGLNAIKNETKPIKIVNNIRKNIGAIVNDPKDSIFSFLSFLFSIPNELSEGYFRLLRSEEVYAHAKESFEIAETLKQRYGVKEFLKFASKKHRDELKKLMGEK